MQIFFTDVSAYTEGSNAETFSLPSEGERHAFYEPTLNTASPRKDYLYFQKNSDGDN